MTESEMHIFTFRYAEPFDRIGQTYRVWEILTSDSRRAWEAFRAEHPNAERVRVTVK